MNRFLLKLAMLLMFILAVLAGWGALSMTFSVGVWNLVLGIVGIFFFFRALELVDKINNLRIGITHVQIRNIQCLRVRVKGQDSVGAIQKKKSPTLRNSLMRNDKT